MKKYLSLFLLTVLAASLSSQEESRNLRRLALLVGSNAGGKGRVELKYAEKDARTFSSVMRELGGLDPRNEHILYSPDRKTLVQEFSTLKARSLTTKDQAARTEFLFYYSGHSDDEGILLGNEKLLYSDLKKLIGDVKAEVDVVILDSCSSGAITRLKGGTKAPPFLLDESSSMSGHAYLTSSSEFEATQESDKIRGSFFTYYLVTGLRGAADASGDGKITLNEAYSHAFAETLARTENTQAGPQHPSYNIKLTGSGDLVLTDVRSAETKIIFDEALKGRITIRDDRENLVAETLKKADKSMEFSLPQGTYSITLLSGDRLFKTKVTLERSSTTRIGLTLFSPIGKETETVRRGSDGEPLEPAVIMQSYDFSIYSFTRETDEFRIGHNFSLNLIAQKSYRIEGAQIGVGLESVTTDLRGLQLSAGANLVGRNAKGAQITAGANIVSGDFSGAQLSGIVNFVDENFVGFQAGVVNIVGGSFTGFQTANINYAKDFSGFRLGLLNVGTSLSGAEIGLVNVENEVSGFQLGLVNVTSASPEIQIGLVNAAKEGRGFQLGLVNVTDTNEGLPIGLVSVVLTGGQTHSLTWIDEKGYCSTALVHGSKRVYNVYALGARIDGERATAELGLGFSAKFGGFFLNLEGLIGNAYPVERSSRSLGGSNELLQRTRLYGGYSFAEHFSLLAGASCNLSWDVDGDNVKYAKIWPGFFFGLRI